MTDDMMNLRALVEKAPPTRIFCAKMYRLAAHRLMELGSRRG